MIDVMYPLGGGSNWDNNELKYSLRSVEKHCKNVGNIIIVGKSLPAFINPDTVIFIEKKDEYWKEKNIMLAIKFACEVSERFMQFNDDYFVSKDVDFLTMPTYCREFEDMGAWLDYRRKYKKGRIGYTRILNRTYHQLKQLGLPSICYDIHIPMLIESDKYLDAIDNFDWERKNAMTYRAMYGNWNRIPAIPHKDGHIDNPKSIEELEFAFKEKDFISSKSKLNHHIWGTVLDKLFSTKSKYEIW